MKNDMEVGKMRWILKEPERFKDMTLGVSGTRGGNITCMMTNSSVCQTYVKRMVSRLSELVILMMMVFLHIVEDFHLQGIMANMKQKSWWSKQTTDPLYRNDYLPVILLHGFEWAIFISIPLMFNSAWDLPVWFCGFIAVQGLIHSGVDHLKANCLKINLVTDQTLHMVQILSVWAIYVGVVC